ncbi:putative lysin [Achromobacter phage vB_AxyP_19-32_Axy23]|uniref:Lysozyme n=1 Tax=Achromobacter phage vB_AxyP_19-32_Axy23 TaxID=2591047 RepID=A0A514CW31_9CAUD|nr:putative lysin [Achromobacter phage vB_AxyP_19-32_Axy23]
MEAIKIARAAALAVTMLLGLEAMAPRPYLDIAGVLTDCVGNTKNVSWDKLRTKAECTALLETEVGRRVLDIAKDFPDDKWTVNNLAAYTSWHYNVSDVGRGTAYDRSTVRKLIRAGQYTQACYGMRVWNKITVNGKLVESRGLNNRRDKEIAKCLE